MINTNNLFQSIRLMYKEALSLQTSVALGHMSYDLAYQKLVALEFKREWLALVALSGLNFEYPLATGGELDTIVKRMSDLAYSYNNVLMDSAWNERSISRGGAKVFNAIL